MAPLNGRPPDRREKPSSATSVIDIGSNPRTSSYPGKLVKEKEKIAGQTTLKIGNLNVNSYANGLLRVPTEEREVARASHDVNFYVRKYSAANKSLRAQPQVRNSTESRPSIVTDRTRKDNNDGPIAAINGQVGPDTNNCRVSETKTNEKISAWDHLSKISQKVLVQAPKIKNNGKIDG